MPKVPKIGFYLAVVNQLGYGNSSLSKQNNAFYNQVRKDADQASYSWSKGLEFGLLKAKTQFSIGVQTSSQTLNSNYVYHYKVFDSLPVYNPGRTQIIGYFLLRGRDTFINEENQVKINKVQIPLSFTRLLTLGSQTKLILGTSMVLDYSRKFTGTKILNPVNNQLYFYKTLQGFERQFNLLPSIQLGIQYQLNKNFLLQTSAFGNAALYNRFKNNFAAKEQAYNLGLNVKLLYLIK